MPGFPNFFCLYGPGMNLASGGSLIFQSECQVNYVMSAIHEVLAHEAAAVEVREDDHRHFVRRRTASRADGGDMPDTAPEDGLGTSAAPPSAPLAAASDIPAGFARDPPHHPTRPAGPTVRHQELCQAASSLSDRLCPRCVRMNCAPPTRRRAARPRGRRPRDGLELHREDGRSHRDVAGSPHRSSSSVLRCRYTESSISP